jgi:flagellar M-ring protein FliF
MPDSVLTVLNRIGGGQRAATLMVAVAAFAVIWGFSRWGTAPRWVPVASGLPIERVGEATQRLEENDIQYRLERGGTLVTVPDQDLATARVLLAGEGLTGTMESPGFELFDQPSWGMTDFTQRVNYRRALEGELERTIGQMRGVDHARVHLALRQGSFLRASDDSGEASVVLRLTNGALPSDAVVEGVQSLVSNSVQGLAAERVAIIDDRGRLLSSPDAGSGAGLTSAQLRVRSQIEGYLESKAEELVSRIVGPGNATIRVAAALNFDQIDRTVQALDPDQQMLVSEDRAEITPGSEAQGAGSVTTNAQYDATRSVETLARGGARLERLTVAVVVADRAVEAANGRVTYEPRTPQELREVETLVSNAVGITTSRGDEITVVATQFTAAPVEEFTDPGVDLAGIWMATERPLITLAALGIALFLALRILALIKTMAPPRSTPQLSTHPEGLLAPAPSVPEPILSRPAHPGVQLSDPEMTARVLRSWMNEG